MDRSSLEATELKIVLQESSEGDPTNSKIPCDHLAKWLALWTLDNYVPSSNHAGIQFMTVRAHPFQQGSKNRFNRVFCPEIISVPLNIYFAMGKFTR